MSSRCLLYYITDRTAFAPDELTRRRLLLAKIAEATRANVDYLQLREKDLATRDLEALAREAVTVIAKLRTENRELRTALLINSRTDVAIAVGADGVHLRSRDISPNDVMAIWGKTLGGTTALGGPAAQSAAPSESDGKNISSQPPIIGVSCHAPEEVRQAEQNSAAFAVFAPVFEKKNSDGTLPTGPAQLSEACKARIPILALGGVTIENAKECLAAGAAGIAAIRLFQQDNIAEVAQKLRNN